MRRLFIKIEWMAKLIKPMFMYIFLITIIGVAISSINVYRAVITKTLIDSAIYKNMNNTTYSLIILGFVILSDLVLNAFSNIISAFSSTKLLNIIQGRIFSHSIHSKFNEITKFHSGDIITRITNDSSTITALIISVIPNVISLLVLLFSSFFVLLSYEPFFAFSTVCMSFVSLIFSRFYGKRLKKLHIESQQNESKYTAHIQESLRNNVIVKTFCLEKNVVSKLLGLQKNRLNLSISKSKLSSIYSTVIGLCYYLTIFLVFCWGAVNLSKGVGTFGTLTALIQLTGNVQGPISGLASSLSQFVTAFASSERLMEIENLNTEITENRNIDNFDISTLSIRYNNVYFGYENQLPVLKDISLNFNSGEIVALVGSSGAGKTTLIRLLLSLITSKHGSLNLVDNNQSIKIDTSTRSFMSYVPQGNTLFSGTIEENLKYGLLDATEEDMSFALKAACATDFVNKLPNKLNTFVGENGIGLSEGQAQRLVIARALISKKPILILDEATSALDMDTEVEVLKSIKTLDYHPTCIIITHRPSALAICDRVLKLESGNISEIDRSEIEESAISSLT